MNHVLTSRLIGIALVLLAGGCANVGTNFDPTKARNLDLGSMHDTEFRAAFGDPRTDIKQSSNDGSFEEVTYMYAHADLSNAQARQLNLEFRDGLLNAFNYLSSFDEDKTTADTQKMESIKKGVSTKADVLAILGPPGGKVKSPTQMTDFVKYDKPGVAEMWCWAAFGSVSTFGDHSTSSTVIVVSFDKNGVATDIVTQQQSNAGQ